MKFLIITTSLPQSARGGGEIATSNFIDALCDAGHQCVVLGYVRPGQAAPEPASSFVSAGYWPIETQHAGLRPIWWMGKALAQGRPFSVVKFISHGLRQRLAELLAETTFDAVIFDHANMIWAIDEPDLPDTKILLAHNVEWQAYGSLAELTANPLRRLVHQRESDALSKIETALDGRVDQIWTLSEQDCAFFRSQCPNTEVIHFDVPGSPIGPTAAPTPNAPMPQSARYPIGLIGSWTWEANRLGLNWFLADVVPRLPQTLEIYISGHGFRPSKPMPPNVHYIGFQPSAEAFLRRCDCVAIPTVCGSGVQIKTIETISAGIPAVVTPLALRGLTQVPDFVQIAHDAAAMAEHLTKQASLLTNPTERRPSKLEIAGRNWAENRKTMFKAQIATAIGTSTPNTHRVETA